MAAATFMAPPDGPRRKQSPVTFGRVLAVVGVGLVLAIGYSMLSWQTVSDRPNEMKTTQVILPPPPPPPPPPEPEVVEQPPEPTVAPPIEQPQDTPPPPDQSNSDPTPGDSALTAREGAGPSNYGLAAGDGSGTRIGGRPGGGGDAFRAYASVAQSCIQRAAQADRDLSRGRYRAQIAVTMTPDGRIANARVSGVDDRRAARIREVLNGVQCQAPPAGLPLMRLELSTRSGG
ncbi:MAG: TonB-dependent receptor [Sphingobium sp.]|nr:TonB-dependent receptor [Sphingobium sp.]